jgi:hypothetical protein
MSGRQDRGIIGGWLVRLTGVAAVASVGACLSPTLPLPPPAAPDQIGASTAEPGVWDIRGTCDPGAVVLVKNLRTKTIAGVEDRDANGRYLVRIEAEQCDPAVVWEIIGTTVTEATGFTIETVVNGTPAADTCSPE